MPKIKLKVIPGKVYGRLSVIREVERLEFPKKSRRVECLCECGNRTEATLTDMLRGFIKSCGCLHDELTRALTYKHGHTDTPEFNIWTLMLRRCYNQKDQHYQSYGGRGITICEEWRKDFAAFLAHVGPRPSRKHSIDRYPDNNGNYEPGNVRWATQKEQCANRRNTPRLELRGETLPLMAWAERFGINAGTIRSRLKRGWPVDDALFRPGCCAAEPSLEFAN